MSGEQMLLELALIGVCPAFSLACTAGALMVVMYSFATFCISTLRTHVLSCASLSPSALQIHSHVFQHVSPMSPSLHVQCYTCMQRTYTAPT